MLEHLKKYAQKIEEKRYPPASISEAVLLLFLGDRVYERARDIMQVLQKRWSGDIGKKIFICFLNRTDEGEFEFPHYRFLSDGSVKIPDSMDEIKGLNNFFRKEMDELTGIGNRMKIVVLTCPEDMDSSRAADITAIAKSFCEVNVTMNITSYLNVLLPPTVRTSEEDKRIRSFFERAIRWKDSQYETEPVFCRFEDSEPEKVIASNNGLLEGLLVFDARDENNKDTISDMRQVQMLANTLEFSGMFGTREKFLQIPGDQPTGVGYEFVLAAALDKKRWNVILPPSPGLLKFHPDEIMKKAAAAMEEELRILLRCAVFARNDSQYEKYGDIMTAGKNWESLEKEYFGDTLRDLYCQWEEELMKTPLPTGLKDKINAVVSVDEIKTLRKRFVSVKETEPDQSTSERNYAVLGSVFNLDSPWSLRDIIANVYENCAEASKNRLYARWAGECLVLLEEKQAFLEKQQEMADQFFVWCDEAMKELQKIWKEWSYAGPEMKMVGIEDKQKLREKIIDCMEAGDSDFEEVFSMVEDYILKAYPEKEKLPEPVYYCRLASSDLHGGMSSRHREVENGIARGKKVAFFEPRTFGEIQLIKNMSNENR